VFGDSQGWVIRRRRQRANLITEILSGEDRNNAGMSTRRRRIDAFDARVPMGTSEDCDMKYLGQLDVVDVLPKSAH
jgi:hypothetical protein